MLSIVSLLSAKNPFMLPLEKKDQANRAKLHLAGEDASDHRVRSALVQWGVGWRRRQ